jgi:endonuclease YncB( thermonuclease family)
MQLLAGIVLIAASLALPLQACAQTDVSGAAHVVDGDTIHLSAAGPGVVKVRLQGVAAPERSDAGGAEATRFVEQLAEGRQVRCELDGSRSKDRVVGVCFVGGEGVAGGGRDIGAAVIEAGLARDCPRFSGGRYKALERPAAAGLPYPSYCVPRQKGSTSSGASPVATASEPPNSLAVALYGTYPHVAPQVDDVLEHGGGLNTCGCHFNRKTGECHCHRFYGCGCACQAPSCPER